MKPLINILKTQQTMDLKRKNENMAVCVITVFFFKYIFYSYVFRAGITKRGEKIATNSEKLKEKGMYIVYLIKKKNK
jgi:ABC-type multidrug transport system permease subunit